MTSNLGSPWSDDRNVQKLRDLWPLGTSCSQIARIIGCGLTRNAVVGKAHRLGLEPRIDPKLPVYEQVVQRAKYRAAPRPKKEKRVTLPEPPTQTAAMPIPFAQASRFQCLYAVDSPNRPGTAETPVCGALCVNGERFCGVHLAVCWKGKPPRRHEYKPMNKTWGVPG